jgi:hypothetical protein
MAKRAGGAFPSPSLARAVALSRRAPYNFSTRHSRRGIRGVATWRDEGVEAKSKSRRAPLLMSAFVLALCSATGLLTGVITREVASAAAQLYGDPIA